jgi:hypothetical protein
MGIPLHRPAGATCDHDRPSLVPDGGFTTMRGQCTTDADCADGGVDGRCLLPGPFKPPICTYDSCFQDSDCGTSEDCVCRDYQTIEENDCVPSNCRIDSDCGDGGYCSPAFGGCAPVIGIVGYYCHTPTDECRVDSDCNNAIPGLHCIFDPMKGDRWICAPLDCTG